MQPPEVVRCRSCDAVHCAVTTEELRGENLDRYRRCSSCGRQAGFVASDLRVDEVLTPIPACLAEAAPLERLEQNQLQRRAL